MASTSLITKCQGLHENYLVIVFIHLKKEATRLRMSNLYIFVPIACSWRRYAGYWNMTNILCKCISVYNDAKNDAIFLCFCSTTWFASCFVELLDAKRHVLPFLPVSWNCLPSRHFPFFSTPRFPSIEILERDKILIMQGIYF